METGRLLTGLILFVFGGLSVLRTDIVMNYRIWISKRIYGAEYKPTKKTFQIQKVLGILFVLLGLLLLTGVV
jgi:hypothetical protein